MQSRQDLRRLKAKNHKVQQLSWSRMTGPAAPLFTTTPHHEWTLEEARLCSPHSSQARWATPGARGQAPASRSWPGASEGRAGGRGFLHPQDDILRELGVSDTCVGRTIFATGCSHGIANYLDLEATSRHVI